MVYLEVLFSRHLITHIWPPIPFRKTHLFPKFVALSLETTEFWNLLVSSSARSMSIFVIVSRPGFPSSLDEPLPQHPLLLPVRQVRNCSHFAFAEAGDGVGGGFKVEDRLLDVGSEVGEVDGLRYAGTGGVLPGMGVVN